MCFVNSILKLKTYLLASILEATHNQVPFLSFVFVYSSIVNLTHFYLNVILLCLVLELFYILLCNLMFNALCI